MISKKYWLRDPGPIPTNTPPDLGGFMYCEDPNAEIQIENCEVMNTPSLLQGVAGQVYIEDTTFKNVPAPVKLDKVGRLQAKRNRRS
jgi:hypothetical protein